MAFGILSQTASPPGSGVLRPRAASEPLGNGATRPRFVPKPPGDEALRPRVASKPPGNWTTRPRFASEPPGNGALRPRFTSEPADNRFLPNILSEFCLCFRKSPKGDGYNIKNIVFKALRPCKTPKTSFLRLCDLAKRQKHRFLDFATPRRVKNIVFEALRPRNAPKTLFLKLCGPRFVPFRGLNDLS